jgi:hypothetical protein
MVIALATSPRAHMEHGSAEHALGTSAIIAGTTRGTLHKPKVVPQCGLYLRPRI